MKKLMLIFLGCVLCVAVGLQVHSALQPKLDPVLQQPLTEILPPAPSGWSSEDLPMAESVGMQERVEDVLQYDDAVFRVYQRGDTQIAVYIAYWHPGKVSISKAGTHTPDTCWVAAGWHPEERESGLHRTVDGIDFKPAEWGVYAKDGARQHVIFWHLVGDQVYGYDQYGWDRSLYDKIKRHLLFLGDISTFGLDQRKEQFFIRISSNRSLDDVWFEPVFADIMRSLQRIGLEEESAPQVSI